MDANRYLRLRFLRFSVALATSALVLSFFPSVGVDAGSGDLDPSFGIGGKVMTRVGAYGGNINTLAIQPDGKIIAAGRSSNRDISYGEDFGLTRYNPDGSLDISFGTGGIVQTDYFGDQDHINAVAVQADGKVVAAGLARADTDIYFGLARYDRNGQLDPTFGMGGKVITRFAGYGDEARALVIQPDGKILVGGSAVTIRLTFDFALARYNPDGSLDSSFGTAGKVMSDFDGLITRLVLQPDGKIIAGGITTAGDTNSDFALARYNPDGSLDTSFGTDGKVTTDFNKGADFLSALGLQSDGKIVAFGDVDLPDPLRLNSQPCLARYTQDGRLDTSFGSDGKVMINDPFTAAHDLVLQANNKIIVAGLIYTREAGGTFGLARYTANGSLDASFGVGGIIATRFLGNDRAYAVALMPDGRIVAGGVTYYPGTSGYFALARYANADDRFDVHLNDEAKGRSLGLNSMTGEYLFTDCNSGLRLAGIGQLQLRGCKIIFEDSGADYTLSGKINRCALTGKATLEVQSPAKTFVIKTNDISQVLSSCH